MNNIKIVLCDNVIDTICDFNTIINNATVTRNYSTIDELKENLLSIDKTDTVIIPAGYIDIELLEYLTDDSCIFYNIILVSTVYSFFNDYDNHVTIVYL